jgi:hypothetical protein
MNEHSCIAGLGEEDLGRLACMKKRIPSHIRVFIVDLNKELSVGDVRRDNEKNALTLTAIQTSFLYPR